MERFSLLFIVVLHPDGPMFRYVGRKIERNGCKAGDHEVGSACRAAQLVAAVDIELVDIDPVIARRTIGHDRYSPDYSDSGGTPQWSDVPSRALSAGGQQPIDRGMAASATAPKTVVVADDTADIRDRFAAALEDAGHTAIGVGSAAELIAFLREQPKTIDLLVLNLRLVPPPAVDLIRAIRECGACRLPILVMSGSITNAQEIRQLAGLGVAGYVNEHSGAAHIVPLLAPHLFPDSFDRRLSPRVAVGIPVACRFDDTIVAARIFDLGKGGLGIWTTNPLPPGTAVDVRFRLPTTQRDIEVRSRVVWSDRRRGMGLRFERVDSADQATIDDFVDRNASGNEAR